MLTLARLIVRKPVAWATVLVVLLLVVVSLFAASKIEHDDDVLAFLPRKNPEVRVFYEVNSRFGGLDVAIVGLGAPDVLAPDFVARLAKVTKELNATDGIGFALSLTSVEDFASDPQKGGIRVAYLVDAAPKDAAESAALREKVLSREHVVGNLVSADGKAALIYCFGAHEVDPKAMAAKVKAVVEAGFPGEEKHWGGAPFISSYIYNITQKDLTRLVPWAVVAIVLFTVASFRDVIGSALALLTTAISIVMSLGLMGALGVRSNIMLGSMPVILFAVGSAYSIHVLTRYYTLAREHGCEDAIARTLVEVGPPVVAAGLTTVAGLISFVVMDIQPMNTFGWFTALGIFVSLVLSMTFVPAVIRIAKLKGKPKLPIDTTGAMARFCAFAQRRRLPIGIAVGVLSLVGAVLSLRVHSRMDNATFFAKGSPPDQAERFLIEHFGGAEFIQLQVHGDMNDPNVLRQMRALGDRVELLPGVTSVNHVGSVVAQINAAMEGDQRLPDTAAKVKLLYRFLEGNRAVRQFVTDDRQHGLIQIKIRVARPEDVEPLLERVEAISREVASQGLVAVDMKGQDPRREAARAGLIDMVVLRIQAASKLFGVSLPEGKPEELKQRIRELPAEPERGAFKKAIVAFLTSDEFSAELPETPSDAVDRAAEALAGLPAEAPEESAAAALGAALEKPATDEGIEDIASSAMKPLEEIRRRQIGRTQAASLLQAASIQAPEGPKGERYVMAVANALLDLSADTALAPVAAAGAEPIVKLGVEATGLPVLNRGLSRSVTINQIKSLVVALVLVLAVMVAMYRSLWSGLTVTAPILVTLLIVYGAMGLFNIGLDVGTSMLASLIIGAGVDYAVHLAAGWGAPPDRPLAEAAAAAGARSGPGIWLNALMVASGFLVLTLGEAKPLKNVGGLTAAAMIVAALATFLVMPALARKHRYWRPARIPGSVSASDADTAVVSSPP